MTGSLLCRTEIVPLNTCVLLTLTHALGCFFVFFSKLRITPKLRDRDQFNVFPSGCCSAHLFLSASDPFISLWDNWVHTLVCTNTGNAECLSLSMNTRYINTHTHTDLLLSGPLSLLLGSVCFWLSFNGLCLPRHKISIIGTIGRLLSMLLLSPLLSSPRLPFFPPLHSSPLFTSPLFSAPLTDQFSVDQQEYWLISTLSDSGPSLDMSP